MTKTRFLPVRGTIDGALCPTASMTALQPRSPSAHAAFGRVNREYRPTLDVTMPTAAAALLMAELGLSDHRTPVHIDLFADRCSAWLQSHIDRQRPAGATTVNRLVAACNRLARDARAEGATHICPY